jgi:hypothetical protein
MAGEVDQDAPRGTHSILNWYDSTRPMFIDLVGDYAGKELFLVEGDSLLRECFEDERIDFQGKFPMRPRPCDAFIHSTFSYGMLVLESCDGWAGGLMMVLAFPASPHWVRNASRHGLLLDPDRQAISTYQKHITDMRSANSSRWIPTSSCCLCG